MKLGRLIAGLVGGATFGVLFAPKKGSQLRKELKKTKGKALGKAFKNAGVDALEEMKKLSEHEQVAAFLQMSEDRIKEIATNLESGDSELVEQAKEKFEAISAFAMEKADGLKALIKEYDEEYGISSSVKGKKKKPTKKKKATSSKKTDPKKKAGATKKTPSKKKVAPKKKPTPASKKKK